MFESILCLILIHAHGKARARLFFGFEEASCDHVAERPHDVVYLVDHDFVFDEELLDEVHEGILGRLFEALDVVVDRDEFDCR